MLISKRSQIFLSITLIFVVSSMFLSSHYQNPQTEMAPNSSVDTSNLYMEQVNRRIVVGRYGISSVSDQFVVYNNGSVPVNFFYYTLKANLELPHNLEDW